ncbi:unnamed protein product [Alternaria alternata]
MAEATVRSNKRQAHHDESESNTAAPDVGAVRKRRAFLQTMGQQLREFGTEGTSPQDHNRNTFGTSPGSNLRPPSSAGNVAANQASVRHVDTPESDAAPGEDDQLPAGAAKSASRWLWKLDEVRPLELESVTPTIAFDDLLEWSHTDDIDQALEVEAEHTKWWNTVDEHLSDDQQTQTISKTHQVTLIVLRFESVLALHRSVLATSKKNAAYNAALQRCISASRSIINTLHKALRGFGAFDGSPGQHGYERTPLLWPSFTWAVWMSTFIILSAAAEEQVSRDIALRLSDRSVQILKHLSSRGTSWPDACIVAVQNLAVRLDKQSNRGPTNTSGDGSRTAVRSTRNSSLGVGNLPAQRQTSEARLANHTPVRPNPVTGTNTPVGQPQRLNNQSHAASSSTTFTNTANEPSFPNVNLHHTDVQAVNSLGTDYLAGAGNFLGIAQQYSDNPLPNEEIMHLFNGEDINYWFGNDSGMAGNSLYYDQNFH